LLILLVAGSLFAACFEDPTFSAVTHQDSSAGTAVAGLDAWPMEGYGLTRNRTVGGHIPTPLRVQREFHVGGSTQFVSPAVIAGGLMFAEGEGTLHALALDSGREVWQIHLPGSFLSPTVLGDSVFARAESGEDGYVYALSAEAGAKLWEFKFPQVGSSYDNIGGHVTSPIVAGGLVLIGAAQTLFALDAESGEPVWRFEAAAPIASSATVAEDLVYVADFTQLYALDLKTGEAQWAFDHGTVSLFFAPIVIGERVIVTSYDTAFALNRTDGRSLWSRRFRDMQVIPAAASAQYVFVKSANRLFALAPADGAIAWEYGATNFVSMPVLTDEHVYVVTRADGGSQLRALNHQNGSELWRSDNVALANAAPIATGESVYVRTVDGNILAFGSTTE
jgi:outer membrane protein assembly factor BamB